MIVLFAELLVVADPFMRAALRGSLLKHARGEWRDLVRHHIYGHRLTEVHIDDSTMLDDDMRSVAAPDTRPNVDAAVREAIAAARALQPAPRNRHERRKVEALRRKWVRL